MRRDERPLTGRGTTLWLRPLLAAALLSASAGCYFLQAAQGQYAIGAHSRPIPEVLADPASPPELKAQLSLVERLRDFSVRSLALPDNKSYRRYADLHRDYVVWNVFATPEFSVDPVRWCFPVAGCVAYRGYFHEADARDFGLGLESEGNDVLVGGVPAYSTLGHFADPVLNTMIDWDEAELASLLFHELAHQVAYVKDDTGFNEAFATTVEREGVRRWFADRGDADSLARFEERSRRAVAVADLLAAERATLAALYSTSPHDEALRIRKREELDRLRVRYEQLRAAGEVGGGYAWLFGPMLNNASLLAVATYEACVPALRAILAEAGGDLPLFYARVRELASMDSGTRHRELASRATGSTCR